MVLSKDHYLNLKGGIFDLTTKEDLDHLFQTLARDPKRDRLVIHFHGGLVSRQAGMATAEMLMEDFSGLNAYQVFFVWESGLFDVIEEKLNAIYKERIFQRLLMRITQFATAKIKQKDEERGGSLELPDELEIQHELDQLTKGQDPFAAVIPAELPPNEKLQKVEEDQFRQTLTMDYVLREETQAIANALHSPGEINAGEATRDMGGTRSTYTLMSPEVLEEILKEAPEPESRGIVTTTIIIAKAVMALAQAIKRFADGRDHGVYATVLEELLRQFYIANAGKDIWDQMKQDTIAAFGNDPEQYGGTRFLKNLKEYCASEQHTRPQITLIGHSAGAIYVCHFLRYADEWLPRDVTFDVVFLAPACTFELFSETYEKYKHRIANIRVFGMSDELERADHLPPVYTHLPPIYTHSLLYLVSGIFEEGADIPLVGMQRYYSGQAPYDIPEFQASLQYLLDPLRQRTVWSTVNGGSGLSSSATTHGHFYQDIFTSDSLRYIIANGL